MDEATSDYWDYEVKAQSSLFDLKLRETWAYRDLLLLMVRRDFVSFYKQTVLGPVWFFIQPVITIIFYTVVFGKIAGIPTNNIPKPLFYLAGTIIWNYFADCLTKTSTVFRDSAGLMGKVYFPRLIMPLSIISSNLIRFSVQFVLFIILLTWFSLKGASIAPNFYILLFPLLLLLIAAQGLGLGMMISAVTTKYRDIAFIVSFGVPLLMYATTVIYPLSEVQIKYPAYSWLVKYNPVTAVIETFRYSFFGEGSFSWNYLGYNCLISLIIVITGVVIFNKVEKTFIDTV